MSTTFWIKTDNWTLEEIAYRWNRRWIYFTNPIASMLSDNTKVIPLDNTAQWIETIWDIKKAILKDLD